MKSYDVIVFGAGIAGLSAARELAKRKQKVLVFEKEMPAGQASSAAAGMVDPYSESGEDSPLLRFGLEALRFYPEFLDELGKGAREEIEYEPLGILYAALNDTDESVLKKRARWQQDQGFGVEMLSGAEVRRLEPSVSSRVRSGIHYPGIAKLNAGKLTAALFRAAKSAGAEIQISKENLSVWIEGGKVRGAKCGNRAVEAPCAVVAAGCWSDSVLPPELQLHIKPVRGQILILRASPAIQPQRILHTLRWAYVIPWPEGRLLAGTTFEFDAGYKPDVTAAGRKDILSRAGEMIEGLDALVEESSWAGLRPFSEQGPRVGPGPVPGLFFAAGYYRSGILIGPLAGKRVAESIVTGSQGGNR